MNSYQPLSFFRCNRCLALGTLLCMTVLAHCFVAPMARGAISWDAQGNSQWWFDPVNWSNDVLPPDNGTGSATDAQINIGTGAWDLGEGVVYDPANDPFFAATGSITFPPGYGAQLIDNLYISRTTTLANLLTIKGDLEFRDGVGIGRSSGVDGVSVLGRVNQVGGIVSIPNDEFDIGAPDTSNAGIGDGIYDYRGGTLDIGNIGGVGLRMSHGSSSTNGVTGDATGASGVAKFIVHNPNSGGYVRSFNVTIASYAGVTADGGTTVRDPDGVTRGVGIFEFHYENGRTRPFQVQNNLSINNGSFAATGGSRSSRLELVLGEAACSGTACVPNDIGLFDVNFGNIFGGSITGSGDLDGDTIENNDRVFSNADASAAYRQGDTVSASYGGTRYDWKISYTGDITWTDANSSVVAGISETGGTDIVLIGLGSESVGLAGDFDSDGDVDGNDFLVWQRGGAPGGVTQANLTAWQTNYGVPVVAAVAAVPEPASLLLLSAGLLSVLGLRRR